MDDIEARLRLIETEVQALKVNLAVNVEQNTNVEKRLSSIEDSLGWVIKLIIGGFIAALVAMVMSGREANAETFDAGLNGSSQSTLYLGDD